jgi:hypothetical protein
MITPIENVKSKIKIVAGLAVVVIIAYTLLYIFAPRWALIPHTVFKLGYDLLIDGFYIILRMFGSFHEYSYLFLIFGALYFIYELMNILYSLFFGWKNT